MSEKAQIHANLTCQYKINMRKSSEDPRISSGLASCNASLINVEEDCRVFFPFLMKNSTADNTYHKTV